MTNSSFVYVTYIRSSQQKVWDALTKPEFQKQYWFGGHLESDWKKGSPWKMVMPEQGLTDSGEVLESDPPNRAERESLCLRRTRPWTYAHYRVDR